MAPVPGPRFPFINLEKAVGRAKELYEADRNGRPMPVKTALEVWGYSPKSSGGFQTVSALKMYGLIDDAGANESRTVGLSYQGKLYFMEEREEEQSKLLREFAVSPKLLNELWEEWAANPPADNVARSHLKIGKGLNDQSARAVLGVYKDNIEFAALANSRAASDKKEAPSPQATKEESQSVMAYPKTGEATAGGFAATAIAERVVFVEEGAPGSYLKLIASGEYDDFLLEALEDFVSRQRRRLQARDDKEKGQETSQT